MLAGKGIVVGEIISHWQVFWISSEYLRVSFLFGWEGSTDVPAGDVPLHLVPHPNLHHPRTLKQTFVYNRWQKIPLADVDPVEDF